jgi:N-acetylglutamate synthase-like GNAT family acetyltransferase
VFWLCCRIGQVFDLVEVGGVLLAREWVRACALWSCALDATLLTSRVLRMHLEIRDAHLRDAERVAQLIGELGYPTSSEAVARRLVRLTASEADRCVVAVLDGTIVGMATVHASLTIVDDAMVAKLSAIVVDERYRQRGIGEALVSALEAEALRQGCALLFLTTAETRAEAHAFYHRLGFEETGRRFAKRLA